MSMNENVFLISDASYSNKSKRAGIAVIDRKTGKKHTTAFSNVESSTEAEFVALVYSVTIAIKKGYKNPVFIFDCESLKLENLQSFIKNKFFKAQFLWLKREFVSEADAEARKALILARSLFNLKTIKKSKTENKKDKISRAKKIKIFSSYSTKQIIKASLTIATDQEREVLNLFLKGEYDLCRLPIHKAKNVNLYKFIYRMIPEKKEAFLYFVNLINHHTKEKKFNEKLSNIQLEEKIDLIMDQLQNQKNVS